MGTQDKIFELLLHQKDVESSDLNTKFDSYKCHTLEAMVPVVGASKLQGSNKNVQTLLRLKAAGPASTKNARLKMITINNSTVIEATPQTETEEVSKPELDADLDEYMIEARRIRQNKCSNKS